MNILAIETSCDETGVALVSCSHKGEEVTFETQANALLSQTKTHAEFGGVFPSVAKREHTKALIPLIGRVLKETNTPTDATVDHITLVQAKKLLEREPRMHKGLEDLARYDVAHLDAIAVTVGPGLAPALWVGVNTARALSVLWNKPVIPVNHMHGHLYSAVYPSGALFEHPALALLVSGGHTEFLILHEDLSIEMVGSTRDDAIGEAFDKAARIIDLGYPGGPEIARLAQTAREKELVSPVSLPRPMIDDGSLDVSYSGLKTALLYHTRNYPIQNERERAALAREFENAALDTVVAKTRRALELYPSSSLVIGGGVIANSELRRRLRECAQEYDIPIHLPIADTTTDNALMIAVAAYIDTTYTKIPLRHNVEHIAAIANLSSENRP